jgi:hypothetical protein
MDDTHQYRVKIEALLRQPIFVADLAIMIRHLAQDALADKLFQPVGQDAAGNPQAGFEFLETTDAKEAIRRMSSVQRSPITETVRAIEHRSSPSSFQRIETPFVRRKS